MSENIYDDKRIYWIWLLKVLGVANQSFWTLSRGYRHISDFVEELRNGRVDELTSTQRDRAKKVTFEDAERIIEKCERNNVSIITYMNKEYPNSLRKVHNPPPILFVKGDVTVLSGSAVVEVVGTRKPCEYSLETTRLLCTQLAKSGVLVISGCESGIDEQANQSALEAGFPTAAVCGRGILDKKSVNEMTEKIAENGVVVAEYTDSDDFGTIRFDNRNRIMCSLADCVLFIECAADGHGLNNVRHAQMLGIPIFAVPPADISDKRFFGQRNLIRNGAVPVFDANDLIKVLNDKDEAREIPIVEYEEVKRVRKQKSSSGSASPRKIKKVQKNTEEDLHKSENSVTIDTSALSESQKTICRLIEQNEEMGINKISSQTGFPISVLLNDMVELTMERIVEELPGKRYRLRGKLGEE